MAVSAVGAGDQILVLKRGNRAYRHRFLSRVEMGSALDDVLVEEIGNFVLEQPNLPHTAQQLEQFFFAQVTCLTCHLFSHVEPSILTMIEYTTVPILLLPCAFRAHALRAPYLLYHGLGVSPIYANQGIL